MARSSRAGWTGFAAWSSVIAAATVPWTDFVGHTHWGKVQWIPFVSPPVKPVDIAANVLLYVPFGYGWIRASGSDRAWSAAVLAAALAFVVEWSQLYSHSRFPSLQDLVCNVLGAWLGARWVALRTR